MKKILFALICATIIACNLLSCNESTEQEDTSPAEFVSHYEFPWDSSSFAIFYDDIMYGDSMSMHKYIKGKKSKESTAKTITIATNYLPSRNVQSSPRGTNVRDKYFSTPAVFYALAIKTLEKGLGTDSTAKLIYEAVRFRMPEPVKRIDRGMMYMDYDHSVDIISHTLNLCSNNLQDKIKSVVLNSLPEDQDASWIRYYKEH
ncbi:MAG: hypothetical protein KBC17_01360 [Candidatus Pacebacteria bacterium]|nr:hypothetical protein [Candidatus Paceibacterota bacterium]